MTQWIAGITRGHNGATCLLKDGELVFYVEEERLSRKKYDGGPLAGILKIKEYTDDLVASCYALLNFHNEVLEIVKLTSGQIYPIKKKFVYLHSSFLNKKFYFYVNFLNSLKIGILYGFFVEAFKLGS